ncbi:hypothetical protein F4803DRAFT_573390 [Xylaria telfairii]|nr:hypothetical protein F4803DRAFT_573390 [Xylaria telfairii]
MNRLYDNQHILIHLKLDWSFDQVPMVHQNVQMPQLGNQRVSNVLDGRLAPLQNVTSGPDERSDGNLIRPRINELPRISPSDFPLPPFHALAAAAHSADQDFSSFSLLQSRTNEAQIIGRGRTPFGYTIIERWALYRAMSTHRGRAGKKEEAEHYKLMAGDIWHNLVNHRPQYIGEPPTAAEQSTAQAALINNIIPKMRLVLGEPIRNNSSLLSAINKASPNTGRFHSDGQSPTNNPTHTVKWNPEAFPGAGQELITYVLLEGGQKTMEISRTALGIDASTILSSHVAKSKTSLKQDQWVVGNPQKFQLQWSFVEQLNRVWVEDKETCTEKRRFGEEKAIQMLEGVLSLKNIAQGMPEASFWVFWVMGMRLALEGPTPN